MLCVVKRQFQVPFENSESEKEVACGSGRRAHCPVKHP